MRTKCRQKRDEHEFDPADKTCVEMVERIMAEAGLTNGELARVLDVRRNCVQVWLREYPKFAEAVRRGRYTHDSTKVENSLLKKALGYDYIEVSKEDISLRTKLDGEKIKLPATKVKKTTKHVVPSDTAIIFWLTNRQPNTWKHIQKFLMDGKVQHNHEGKVEHECDLKNVPKEELEQIRNILARTASAEAGQAGAAARHAGTGRGRPGLQESSAFHRSHLAPGRN